MLCVIRTINRGWNKAVHKDCSSLASNAWLLGLTGNQSVGYTTTTTCTTTTIIQIASFRDPEQQQTRQDTQTHLTNLWLFRAAKLTFRLPPPPSSIPLPLHPFVFFLTAVFKDKQLERKTRQREREYEEGMP